MTYTIMAVSSLDGSKYFQNGMTFESLRSARRELIRDKFTLIRVYEEIDGNLYFVGQAF